MKTDRRAFLGAVAALALVKVPQLEPHELWRASLLTDDMLDAQAISNAMFRDRPRLSKAFAASWDHQLAIREAYYRGAIWGDGVQRVPWKEDQHG